MKIGQFYTRKEIHDICGGNMQIFAPFKNGKITCFCLDPKLNPDAPRIVLPAGGKLREKMISLIEAMTSSVPTFLKVESNCWECVGKFMFDKISRSRKDIQIQHHSSKTPKDEIVAVIHLKVD